jgi:NADPH:quinone reductase-like Zn-dependent oxidoreductase/SAM-dependent methyltransferase
MNRYAARHISHGSAIIVSYIRGQLASQLMTTSLEKHSMMAIGLPVAAVQNAFDEIQHHPVGGFDAALVVISCINSPNSVTVSGSEAQLDQLAEGLRRMGVFHRRLRVGLAYHSPQMQQIAAEYGKRLGDLERGKQHEKRNPVMVSSVTGKIVSADEVSQSQYWIDNMVLPVNFLGALKLCCEVSGQEDVVKKLDRSHTRRIVTHGLLEIGPHAALRTAVSEILDFTQRDKDVTYCSALVRNRPAAETVLEAIGTFSCLGFDADLNRITSLSLGTDKKPSVLTDLPPYPFDHLIPHWEESRKNVQFRLRKHPSHDLAGLQTDSNPLESTWRFIIKEEELPWIREHKVDGTVLYPAAGMLVMAIEAAKQLLFEKSPRAFELENVEFVAPILFTPTSSNGIDLQMSLSSASRFEGKTNSDFKFRIFLAKPEGSSEEVCRGQISGDYGKTISDVDHGRETIEKINTLRLNYSQARQKCGTSVQSTPFYESMKTDIGIEYGPSFQVLDDIGTNMNGEAVALVKPFCGPCTEHTIHPTTLDGVLQLTYAALTGAEFKKLPTMVPRRLGRLWISIEGSDHPDSLRKQVHTQANIVTSRTVVANAAVFSDTDSNLHAHIESLEITAVSSPATPKTLDDADHSCHYTEWKTDFDRLTGEEIQKFLEESRDATNEPKDWAVNMEFLMFSFAAIALEEVEAMGRQIVSPLHEYALWLQERLKEFLDCPLTENVLSILLDRDHLRSLYDKVLPNAVARLYILIGENLTQLFLGEVDPLQLLFEDENLMADFYTDLLHGSTAIGPIQRYLDCLVHKWPALDFLEVGAGTGASSAAFLDVMNNLNGGTRFESYTFTDISPSFFGKAQAKLQVHEARMYYKVLNVEEDPADQDFAGEKYDVVVADNILHATKDLEAVLGNLRTLLKPGGKLLLKEMTTGMKVITGFFSGLLPGWWRSTEDYRIAQRSPIITEEQWDRVLKRAGFTGTDFVIRDFIDEKCYSWSFMVSTLPHFSASDPNEVKNISEKSLPIVVLNPASEFQKQVAHCLCQQLEVPESNLCAPEDVTGKESFAGRDCIILNGLDENLLWNMSSSFLQTMQNIVATAKNILWVNGGGGSSSMSPKFSIADGLLRVIRQENNKTKVVLLALDIVNSKRSLEKGVRHITNLLNADDTEPEYVEIDNRLCVNRLVTARTVDQHIFTRLEQPVVVQPIGEKKLRLGVRVPGLLDTVEFKEEEAESSAPLGPDEVIIEVRALGVNFKDCLTMLGQVDTDIIGSECAGVVQKTGSNAGFSPGDRVVAAALDSYRTVVRIGKEMVVKIPDTMSFLEAASFPTAFCTALYSLVHVARLQKGESVLIHAASGGTGQAAVQIALRIGAEVIGTVGSASKKALLMERYGIKDDHIFYSRDTSFSDGVKRVTNGRGVNVVLNSVSGRLLEASWDCVAPFGRFVEIGRKDVDSRGYLPMYPFIRNLSFSGVDLTMVLETNIQLGHQLITEVMALARYGELKPVYPLHSYPVAEIERAFRFMQSGKSSGKIVLEIDKNQSVPVRIAQTVDSHRLLLTNSSRP